MSTQSLDILVHYFSEDPLNPSWRRSLCQRNLDHGYWYTKDKSGVTCSKCRDLLYPLDASIKKILTE